jgi:hypothetical protein
MVGMSIEPLSKQYKTVNGKQVAYHDVGTGDSVVFLHLHRIPAGSARELHCGTGRNRADFYERNRRILLIPLSGGFVEIRLACCGADVGGVGRSVITPVWQNDHTVGWLWAVQGASTGCVWGFGSKG